MWLRIVLAGLAGGVLIFCMGAFNHMVLGFQGRTLMNMPQSEKFMEELKTRDLKSGFYMFPDMPTGTDGSNAEKYKQANERYKAGPAGMLLIVPNGQDMMTGETLFKEFVMGTIAALLASWIASLLAADVGFGRRWFAILLIGVIGWFSYVASYGIWYRFPHNFLHDELFCGLIEWGVAGLAIAAMARRPPVILQPVAV